jgi:hypothetical protein
MKISSFKPTKTKEDTKYYYTLGNNLLRSVPMHDSREYQKLEEEFENLKYPYRSEFKRPRYFFNEKGEEDPSLGIAYIETNMPSSKDQKQRY